MKQLKSLLKQGIKFSVEQLVPRVFMIRNEEEVLKNILTLSREVDSISDVPQVMIMFDQQTLQEVTFTVVLVRVLKTGELSVQEHFAKIQSNVEYLPERCQIVQYLKQKHPIEANVFRIKLVKDPSLLRVDLSLNFYLARQKVSQTLLDTVGKFRDYNGGIIITQREVLTSLKETFHALSLKEPDLLENFYYSLTPIEVQATLSLDSLKTFFELFLTVRNPSFTKLSDFFFKFQRNGRQLFIVIRTSDENFKGSIDPIFSFLKDNQRVATFTISTQNTYFLGYLLIDVDKKTELQISQSITYALESWKSKIEDRQILRLSLAFSIVSLDPRIGGDQLSAVILKMLFEGLMRTNKEGKLEKGLAKHIEISPDQKTYLFKLRSTLWSNGSPVTAYDFEYAWKKVLSPTFKTPFAYLFYPIKNGKRAKNGSVEEEAIGVKALDNQTLKVDLEFPAPYFLELVVLPIYSPIHHLIDQQHPNWPLEDNETYICNGAFQLKKNSPNEGYELTKNPLYWDAANIKLDEIIISKANRYESYEMLQKDLNHWIGTPLGIWDPNFTPYKNDELIVFSNAGVYWFVFNTQSFPFNNKKIRQSLAWSVDRSKLKYFIKGPPTISPMLPMHSQLKTSIFSTYSLKGAQALFKEALKELNISLQDFPIISLIYLTGPTRNQAASFIKKEWETAFGIRCSLQPLEWKVLFTKITEGDFQVGGMTWGPWVNDPIYTLNAFRNSNELINFSKWENGEYREIVRLAEEEIDPRKRQSYYLQAEKILLYEMPVLPLFVLTPPALKKKNFHIQPSYPFTDFKWGYFT